MEKNKKCKNKLKIWENLGNDQRKIPVKVKASLTTLETHSAPTPVERNFASQGVDYTYTDRNNLADLQK